MNPCLPSWVLLLLLRLLLQPKLTRRTPSIDPFGSIPSIPPILGATVATAPAHLLCCYCCYYYAMLLLCYCPCPSSPEVPLHGPVSPILDGAALVHKRVLTGAQARVLANYSFT